MERKSILIFVASAVVLSLVYTYERARAQPLHRNTVVRLAELEIDPNHLEQYKQLLKEEIETSIRVEPGVLALHAVSVKGSPSQIRIFETYADVDAYHAHLKTSHFLRYKTATARMVKSLKLVETEPILLAGRAQMLQAE